MLYSVLDGQLLETTAKFFGHRQIMVGRGSGQFTLGDHPVADNLRAMEIGPSPLFAASNLDGRMSFGPGVPVSTARAYHGYTVPNEPERGRYTVTYPDTPPTRPVQAASPQPTSVGTRGTW